MQGSVADADHQVHAVHRDSGAFVVPNSPAVQSQVRIPFPGDALHRVHFPLQRGAQDGEVEHAVLVMDQGHVGRSVIHVQADSVDFIAPCLGFTC